MFAWYSDHSPTLLEGAGSLLTSAWAPVVTGFLTWAVTWFSLSKSKSQEHALWRRNMLEKIGVEFYQTAQQQVHRVYFEEYAADETTTYQDWAQSQLKDIPTFFAASLQTLSLSARARLISETVLATLLESFNDELFLKINEGESRFQALTAQRPRLKDKRDAVIAEVARLLSVAL